MTETDSDLDRIQLQDEATLTDFCMMVTVPGDPDVTVSNLELETGDDFLLEDGGFLLLE